jgi:PTS system galactitol-specific IIA component
MTDAAKIASLALEENLILTGLSAPDAESAIRALSARLRAADCVKETYAEAVLKRESLHPTGLPTEVPVALPHTDVEHCLKPALAVGVLSAPITFQQMGDPSQTVATSLVFMLSITHPPDQVQWLRRLIDFFQQAALMQQVLAARSPAEVADLLRRNLGVEGKTAEVEMTSAANAIELTVTHPVGLHARPAAKFVQTAAQFPCAVTVANLTSGVGPVNAKSILKVLTLGVSQGHRIRVEAQGEGAEQALATLRALVESKFGEG